VTSSQKRPLKYDTISEESIQDLVDTFYTKIRAHKALGPIFKNKIGTDSSQWKPHLERMYNFWSSVMLGTHRFEGTPMQKHQVLPSFDLSLFDDWLTLFEETAKEIHPESIVDQYREKSHLIARGLKMGIKYK